MSTELFVEPDTLAPADRSILETAAECPRQARFLETGAVLSTRFCMESGNGVHDAMSATITDYVESRGQASFDDTKELFLQELARARPDVQPDVIRGGERSAYMFAKFLHSLNWQNIRCWDGGRGEHSSQLAYDIEEFGLRVTSELDMVYDSESPEVICELDCKSGHQIWRHGEVGESFQFNLHRLLIAAKYPTVKALEVRIFNTRFANMTYPVLFKLDSESLYPVRARVRAAAMAYFKTRDKSPMDCEAWPLVEKCAACPAAHLCDQSKLPEGTPEEWVDKIVGLESQASALSKLAAKYVRETGKDILTPGGNMFGKDRPKKKQAPRMETYQLKSTASPEETVAEAAE
jgi:hypothetical protein